MNNLTFKLFCLFVLSWGTLQAQVTMGSDKTPEDYSVLEIISNGNTGGLRMPHLTTEQRDAIIRDEEFTGVKANLGRGLAIYNIDINCVEYWNNKKWISQCDGSVPEPCIDSCDCDGDGFLAQECKGNDPDDNDPCNPSVKPLAFTALPSGTVVVGTPVTITVTTTGANPINNISIDGGKTRIKGNEITVTPGKVGDNTYTIMVNNCPSQIVTVNITATACAKISSATVTSCLPYMFTYQIMELTATHAPTTTAAAPTFYQWYVDGIAVGEKGKTFAYSPGTNGLTADDLGNMKKTVKIKCDIGNACGTVTSNEYEVLVVQAQLGQLSPIYVKAWSEAAVEENDFTNPDAGLRRVAYAHVNLGAEYELNPCEMFGDLYQWGRKKDGHQQRILTDTDVWPNGIGVAATATRHSIAQPTELDANGQVQSSVINKYGKFIKSSSLGPVADSSGNWRRPSQSDLWGDGELFYNSQSYNPIWSISANNPCPTGWKVPSQKQWGAIYGGGTASNVHNNPALPIANTWSWIGNIAPACGYKLSEALFLPAAGQRLNATASLRVVGNYGFYWSSTAYNSMTLSYYLSLSANTVDPGGLTTINRADGLSIRCIAE